MEYLTTLFSQVAEFNATNPYIDIVVVALVVMGGLLAKKLLKPAVKRVNITYLTFITGTALSAVYMLLLLGAGGQVDFVKGFLSYTVATTFYELIIKELNKKFKTKL